MAEPRSCVHAREWKEGPVGTLASAVGCPSRLVVGLPPKKKGGLAVGQPKTNKSLVVKNKIKIS